MLNQIKAYLQIYFRYSPISRITLVAAVLAGGLGGFFSCTVDGFERYSYTENALWFSLLPFLLLTAFSVIFVVGREQSSGAIRNKIISGYTKGTIGGAWLICTLIFTAICAGCFLTPFLIISRKALLLLESPVIVQLTVTMALLFPLIGTICALLCLLLRRQTEAVFLLVGVSIVLAFAGIFVSSNLDRQPYIETRQMKFTDANTGEVIAHQNESDHIDIHELLDVGNGQQKAVSMSTVTIFNPNPFYIDSPMRELCIILNNLNPAESLFASQGTLDSIKTRQLLNQLIANRDAAVTTLEQELQRLEEKNDPESQMRRQYLLQEINNMNNGYEANEIKQLEDQYMAKANQTAGLPQCLIGVTVLICAVGLTIFRKKDII